MMANAMLHDLGLPYNHVYKTISKDNYASMKVAEKSGFFVKCESSKKDCCIQFISQIMGSSFCIAIKTKNGRSEGA